MVRENDGSSSFLWGAFPGRKAAEGKESQFSSFWDKAVHGAQKLLGLEGELEKEQESREDEARRAEGANPPRSDALSAAPGFGSGGFAGLTRSVRQRALGDIALFSRMDQPRDELQTGVPSGAPELDGDRFADRPGASKASGEMDEPELAAEEGKRGAESEDGNRPEKGRSEASEAEGDEEEEDDVAGAEKSAAPMLPRVAADASSVASVNLLRSDGKGLRGGGQSLGIGDATKAQNMTSGTKSPVAETPRSEAVDTTVSIAREASLVAQEGAQAASRKTSQAPSAAVATASAMGANVAGGTGAQLPTAMGEGQPGSTLRQGQSVGPQGQASAGQRGLTGKANTQVKPALGETSVQPAPAQSGEAKSDTLAFDGERARRELSEGLRRSSEPNRPAPVSTAPIQGQISKPATPPSAAGDAGLNAKAELSSPVGQNATSEAKPEATVAAPAGSQSRSSEAAPSSRPMNASMAGAEQQQRAPLANASQASAEASAAAMQRQMAQSSEAQAAASREFRPVETRPASNRGKSHAVQNSGLGVTQAGQTGSAGQAQSGLSAPSQQRQNFERAPKQESGPALNAGPNAKVEKADGGTAFNFGQAQTQSARRGEAAARMEQPSYSSKTPEEVKEVYQALSKGVERMINSKSDTISVRVNFQQGGSLSLKLSMDKGQVKASMQTDLPGLESMIKSHWSELASDWNARGVRLNAPQFTHEGGESRSESFMTFEQRDEQRQAQAQGGEQRNGRGSNRSGAGASARQASSGDLPSSAHSDGPESLISETELKTYA